MKKVIVASWSQSQGRPMVRVTMSHITSTENPVMAMPHRIIKTCSSQSSARHFRCRCSCRTRLLNPCMIDFRIQNEGGAPAESCMLPAGRRARLLDVAHQAEDLHRVGPKVGRQLVLDRLADLRKA